MTILFHGFLLAFGGVFGVFAAFALVFAAIVIPISLQAKTIVAKRRLKK